MEDRQTIGAADCAPVSDVLQEEQQEARTSEPEAQTPGPFPSIGRIVHYRLSGHDAAAINKRRGHGPAVPGAVVHTGNTVMPGEVYPMMITQLWGAGVGAAVNGQVHLDGNDTLWVTSVCVGDAAGSFFWPSRV